MRPRAAGRRSGPSRACRPAPRLRRSLAQARFAMTGDDCEGRDRAGMQGRDGRRRDRCALQRDRACGGIMPASGCGSRQRPAGRTAAMPGLPCRVTAGVASGRLPGFSDPAGAWGAAPPRNPASRRMAGPSAACPVRCLAREGLRCAAPLREGLPRVPARSVQKPTFAGAGTNRLMSLPRERAARIQGTEMPTPRGSRPRGALFRASGEPRRKRPPATPCRPPARRLRGQGRAG